jgi:hypothetical protein
LKATLRERGIMMDDLFGGYSPRHEQTPKHGSPIVNSMTHSVLLHNKARDVFMATYFEAEIAAKELDVPESTMRLYRDLHSEEKDGN